MADIPPRIPDDMTAYARSPEFTPETLPEKLKSTHALKPDIWGLLHVIEGKLRYTLETQTSGEIIAAAGETIVIQTDTPHRVAFVEPGKFFIEFYRRTSTS